MAKTKIEWADKEILHEVPGYTGYFVSDDGLIYGPSGKLMHQMTMPSGHLYVLCNRGRGKQHKLFVHRAVLLAYVGLPGNGQEARHLDGDPTHNKLSNLAWGTRYEQWDDRRRHGVAPIGESSGSHKLTESQVIEIRRKYANNRVTYRSLAKEYGVSHTTIGAAIKGHHWAHLREKSL